MYKYNFCMGARRHFQVRAIPKFATREFVISVARVQRAGRQRGLGARKSKSGALGQKLALVRDGGGAGQRASEFVAISQKFRSWQFAAIY